ncbi:hypothetical protein [Nitrosomonas marina]|uniref:Uncharacterized protein n=1 Tax=Nitrosomonas marina TaxID=917 RepID=A0A1H8DIE8_9PROT|nr:hypothetical protein [Nitrosomonas marina]SEN07003.1 hypothetical protein SAMN05216325_10727 [Nitrosomonas marina]
MTTNENQNDEQCQHSKTDAECLARDPIYTEEINEYFSIIQKDLHQIDRLVNDAVSNLVFNFKYINELSQSHHKMVVAIEKMSIPKENTAMLELLSKQMEIASKIEHELDSAVISLQFGDLVSQLLAHTAKQIENLNASLLHIDHASSSVKNSTSLQTTNTKLSMAVQRAKTNESSKPVVQHEMQKGEIELF